MNIARIQKILLLIGVAILDIFFVWFAVKLFRTNPGLSTTELYLAGFAACFGGIFIASSESSQRFAAGGGVFAVGVYYFLRATNVINTPLLTTGLGIASLLAAGLLTYIAVSSVKKHGVPKS